MGPQGGAPLLLVLLVVAVSASGVVCQVNVTFPFGPTRFRCTTACEERQCSEKVGCRINAFDPSLDLGDGPVASRNGTFACSDKVCQPGCRELQGCTRPTGVGAPWQYSPLDAPLQLLPFRYADGRAVAAKWVTQEAVKLWDADSRTVSSFRSYFCIKVSQAPHDGGIHTTTGPDKPTAGREQQSRDDVSNLWFLISSTTSAYTSAHRRALAVFMLMDKEVTSTGDVQPRVQVGVFHDGVSSRREGWARLNESILQGADFFNRTIAVWVEYDATEKVIEVSMLPMLDMPAAAFAAACTNVRPRAQRVLKQELDLISLVNDYSYVGFEFATNGSGSSGSHEAASGPPAAGNMNEIFYWHFQTLQGEEYNGHPVADPLPAVGVGSPAASPGAKKMSPERSGRVAALIASAVAGVILLSVVGVLIVRAGSLCRRRCVGGGGSKYVPAAAGKKNWENILWWSRPPGMPMATFSIDQGAPRKFSYGELRQATNNFSPANLLGEGGFGEVYKGVLRDKCTWVAVKRIAGKSRQGEKQFLAEVTIIGRLRHRNLVPLRGWCHNKRGGELMLVYDFMPNSSLDHHILRPSKYRNLSRNSTDTSTSQQVESSRPVLGWATRLHIIKGVAAALLYLHEEWEEVGLKSSVVHRDIKSSNILLDAEWNARLGDFGLAMLVERDKTAETVSRIAGTRGYLAPEYVYTGKVSVQADTYSFGVFMLEVATGRRPIDWFRPENERFLVQWVCSLHESGNLHSAVDQELRRAEDLEASASELLLVLRLGLLCTLNDPVDRPSMRQVVQYLAVGDGCSVVLPDSISAYQEHVARSISSPSYGAAARGSQSSQLGESRGTGSISSAATN